MLNREHELLLRPVVDIPETAVALIPRNGSLALWAVKSHAVLLPRI